MEVAFMMVWLGIAVWCFCYGKTPVMQLGPITVWVIAIVLDAYFGMGSF